MSKPVTASARGCLVTLACLALLAGALATYGFAQTGDAALAQAIELHRTGKVDQAIAAYRSILQMHPDNMLARANLGAALASQGFLVEAIEQYRAVIEADPANLPVGYNLALAEYKLGRQKDATASFEALLQKQPDNRNARVLLSDCYLQQGENKKVIALLEPLAGDDADRALLYVLGTALIRDKQSERGQVLIDRILRDGDSAEAHMMMAAAFMMAGKNQDSLKEYAKAAALNAKLPGVHDAYGHALLGNQQHEEAAVEFRRELENNPHDYDANLFSGMLAKREHKIDEAEKYLKRALELRPGAYETRYQLGSLYVMSNEWQRAKDVLEPLVKERPDFLEAHISLAAVFYRLKQKEQGDREREIIARLNAEKLASEGDSGGATGAAAEGGATNPAPAAAVPSGGNPAKDQRAPDTAAGAAAAKADPNAADATPSFEKLAKGAEEARGAERNDQAISLYRQALELKPGWAEGWWYLGSIYYTTKRYAQCRDTYGRLTEVVPKGGPGWAMLGLCEFGVGEFAHAFEHMRQGRQLGIARGTQLSIVTRYHIALLFNVYKQPEAALQVLYGMARDQDETDALVEAMGMAALRLAMLPERLPAKDRELVTMLGKAHYNVGLRHLHEAEGFFEEALKIYGSVPEVHYNYGVFLLGSNPDAALNEFQAELKISPQHVPARLQIAFEYLKRKDVDAGIKFAREAVALDPESFFARNALGRLLLDKGEVEQAIKELETGMKLEPDSPETAFALARAYAKAGRKAEASRARAEFERLDSMRRAGEGQGNTTSDSPSGAAEAAKPPAH